MNRRKLLLTAVMAMGFAALTAVCVADEGDPPPGAEPPGAAYDFRHACVAVYQDFS